MEYDSLAGAALTTIEMEGVVDGKGGSAITFERIVPMSPQPVENPPAPPFSAGNLFAFNDTIGAYQYTTKWSVANGALAGNNIKDNHGGIGGTSYNLYKCNQGKIYRSTNDGDSWSDITPTGDHPDGSDASAVEYIWYENDPYNRENHYFLARNEVGGAWNSWLLHYNDIADSYSWQKVSGTGGATSVNWHHPNDGASDVIPITQLYNTISAYSTGGGGGKQNIIGVFDDNYSFFVYEKLPAEATAFFVNGASINLGSPIEFAGATVTPDRWQAVGLNNNDGVVVYTDDTAPVLSLQSRVLIRGTGTSLNAGPVVALDETSAAIRDLHISKLGSNTALLTYGVGGYGYYRKGTVTTGVLSWGNSFTFHDEVHATSNVAANRIARLDNSSDWAVITSSEGNKQWADGATYAAWLVDIQGASFVNYGPFLFPGSPTVIQNGAATVFAGTDKFVSIYKDRSAASAWYTVVGQRSGNAITFGTSHSIDDMLWTDNSTDLFEIDSDRVGLLLSSSTNDGGTYVSVGTITGTSIDFSPPSGMDTNWGVTRQNAMVMGTSKLIAVADDSADDLYLVSGSITGGESVSGKGIGMSVAGGGASIYTTYTDGSNLKLDVRDAPSLTAVRTVDLGAGDTNQATSRTLVANPQSERNSNTAFYVYGRMNNPAGLASNPAHIIRSTNGGETFTLIENGWGTDYAAALEKKGRTVYTMRNVSERLGALYAGRVVQSTIPYGVNPGGMLQTNDGYIIVGASGQETNMVRYSVSPFLRWYRLKGYSDTNAITGLGVIPRETIRRI
jgi:hypothetical protein